jgi:hypothetical protein
MMPAAALMTLAVFMIAALVGGVVIAFMSMVAMHTGLHRPAVVMPMMDMMSPIMSAGAVAVMAVAMVAVAVMTMMPVMRLFVVRGYLMITVMAAGVMVVAVFVMTIAVMMVMGLVSVVALFVVRGHLVVAVMTVAVMMVFATFVVSVTVMTIFVMTVAVMVVFAIFVMSVTVMTIFVMAVAVMVVFAIFVMSVTVVVVMGLVSVVAFFVVRGYLVIAVMAVAVMMMVALFVVSVAMMPFAVSIVVMPGHVMVAVREIMGRMRPETAVHVGCPGGHAVRRHGAVAVSGRTMLTGEVLHEGFVQLAGLFRTDDAFDNVAHFTHPLRIEMPGRSDWRRMMAFRTTAHRMGRPCGAV